MSKGSGTNRLTNTQFFNLCQDMLAQRDWLENKKPTLIVAAVYFTNRLKFTVGPTTIRAAQEATGITWATKRTMPPGFGTLNSNKLRATIKVCMRAITDLYSGSGMKTPDWWLEALRDMEMATPPPKVAPAILPNTPPMVFKVGDRVRVDGSSKLHEIRKMNSPIEAVLDNGWSVRVERLYRV